MSIRAKALLILGLTIVAMAAATYTISRGFLLGEFATLGSELAREDVRRVVNALANEAGELEATTWDWSAWDATYAYIQDGNRAYEEENLVIGSFTTLQLNMMALVNTNGEVVWGRIADLQSRTLQPLPGDFGGHLRRGLPLVDHHSPSGKVSGLVMLNGMPVLVCSRPILLSDNSGPIRGALVMGRYLDTPHVRRLARLTGVAVDVVPIQGEGAVAGERLAADGEAITVSARDAGTLTARMVLRDLEGQPCVELRTLHVQRVYQLAEMAVAYFILVVLVSSSLIGLAGFLVLERHVIRRLARLNHDVKAMNASGSSGGRLTAGRDDEVGSLAREFNRLLDSLERSLAVQRDLNDQLEQRVADRTVALSESHAEIRRLCRHVEDVRERERRQAAERVHGELGQSLTAVKMGVEWVRNTPGAPAGAVRARLDELVGMIDEMTVTMQDIAMQLRPSVLDHFGLQAALHLIVRKFKERSGLRCELEAEEFDIDSATATPLLRIVQELLTNVVRHARASLVLVRLRREAGELCLEVEDDGQGIRPEQANGPDALGIMEIRERVASLGGTVSFEGGAEHGTLVSIRAPFPGRPSASKGVLPDGN